MASRAAQYVFFVQCLLVEGRHDDDVAPIPAVRRQLPFSSYIHWKVPIF